MDKSALNQILLATTSIFRKGEVVHGDTPIEKAGAIAMETGTPFDIETFPGGVVTIDMMPSFLEAPENLIKIDLEFIVVGVDKEAAERHRAAFIAILDSYPDPARLAAGPSYIEVGAVIGSQELAFRLFALGEVLDLWQVITPQRLGFKGQEAIAIAKSGIIMMTGYP